MSSVRPTIRPTRPSVGGSVARQQVAPASPPGGSSKKSAEVMHLEQRVRFLAGREQQLSRAAEKLEADLHNAEERCMLRASADTSRLRAELQAALGRTAELQQLLTARKAEDDAALAEACARRDEAVAAMRDMAARAEAQISEFAQLRRDRQTALERTAELEQQLAALHSDTAQMTQDVEDRWLSELGAGEENRRLVDENRRLSAALEEARQETRRVMGNNERLMQQLGDRKQRFQETKELMDGLAREREAVAKETERLGVQHKAEVEELLRKLDAAKSEADRLRAECNEAREKLAIATTAEPSSATSTGGEDERFDAGEMMKRAERLYALLLSTTEDGERDNALAQLKDMRAVLGERAVRLTGSAKQLRASLVPLEVDVGAVLATTHAVQRCIAFAEKPLAERAEWEEICRSMEALRHSAGGIQVEDLPPNLLLPSETQLLGETKTLQDRVAAQRSDAEMRLTDLSAHNSQLVQSAARSDRARDAQLRTLETRLRERDAEIEQLRGGAMASMSDMDRLRHEQLEERERRLRARETAIDCYALDRPDIAGLQEDVRMLEVALSQGIEHVKTLLQRSQLRTPAQSGRIRQTPVLSPFVGTPSGPQHTPQQENTSEALNAMEQVNSATLVAVQAGLEKLIGYIHVLRLREQEMLRGRDAVSRLERQLEDERKEKAVALDELGQLRSELIQAKSQAMQAQASAMSNLASAVDFSAAAGASEHVAPSPRQRRQQHSKTVVFFYCFSAAALLFAVVVIWASNMLHTTPALRPS